jgi:hypothetical protein
VKASHASTLNTLTRVQRFLDQNHIETRSAPDFFETDSMPRLRADSVEAAIRTKVPSWPRCTA